MDIDFQVRVFENPAGDSAVDRVGLHREILVMPLGDDLECLLVRLRGKSSVCCYDLQQYRICSL
jgi:hypothetical protein